MWVACPYTESLLLPRGGGQLHILPKGSEVGVLSEGMEKMPLLYTPYNVEFLQNVAFLFAVL